MADMSFPSYDTELERLAYYIRNRDRIIRESRHAGNSPRIISQMTGLSLRTVFRITGRQQKGSAT
jgi:hypothetical protein